MNISNNNAINILDLSDEMLLAIFSKLNMVDVFYSLVGLNRRINRLIFDPFYIHHLDLTGKRVLDHNSPVNNEVFDGFGPKVLHRVHREVNKLTVDSLYMEYIISITDYPQLHSLSLVNFQQETLLKYLTGNTILCFVTEQIIDLTVQIRGDLKVKLPNGNESDLFALILSLFQHLKDLTINHLLSGRSWTDSTFNLMSTYHVSSTLTKLKIKVNTFDDCLYLLDGHLECLSILIIDIIKISKSPLSNINNTGKLPQLKCFSLSSERITYAYDNRIVPLLRRMLNLEELTLFLSVVRMKLTYIDGTHLYNDILVHMPRLNKFTFSINTQVVNLGDKIDLQSNNDIRHSFIKIGYQNVDSYADVELLEFGAECHVYSLPYQFNTFSDLTNSFQGGRFDKVRNLAMNDIRPFELEFFKIISQDFPFLQRLAVINSEPQKNKQHSSTLITFPHLDSLQIIFAHIDYVEQFLFQTNIRLPRLTQLTIEYEALVLVTNNFTNDATRSICSQLRHIYFHEPFVRPENFDSYFPSL